MYSLVANNKSTGGRVVINHDRKKTLAWRRYTNNGVMSLSNTCRSIIRSVFYIIRKLRFNEITGAGLGTGASLGKVIKEENVGIFLSKLFYSVWAIIAILLSSFILFSYLKFLLPSFYPLSSALPDSALPTYIERQQPSNTRQYHPSKFRVTGPKTNVYKYSYFPRTILEWNSLPQSLYNIHNLDNFKTVLVESRM